MLPSALITFRETIEAVLVIGIVYSFLIKTDNRAFIKYIWGGAGTGILISIILAIIIELVFGGFIGSTEAIFEGSLMLITAGFITWMIMWIHRQKNISQNIKYKIKKHIDSGYGRGIFILVAASILREGTETVLYLKASSLIGLSNQLAGAFIGIIIALGLGFTLFRYAVKINLNMIFNITSIFLIMFAAGLISHGIHEFQEVGMLPVFRFDPVINISHLLDHKSVFGSLLRTFFGYTSKPTILELFSYITYIIFILWLQKFTNKAIQKA